ncbi:hypothetical protein [Botrimarina sp.]|uniref:lipoate--protein ligase family protein n=1 Tax=Botrimarina sp. TaxID=2795802 RepID=UPI0032EC1841
MPLDCRLIIDPPAPGAWNMAVDDALLQSVAEGGRPTLRLYQWSEPTLSLGYFQSYSDRDRHEPSRSLPCVRRRTGGGAIVHDHELTYSLCLPTDSALARDHRALYCKAHRAVIAAVGQLGGEVSRLTLCDPDRTTGRSDEPFLCFLRRSDGDLLVQGPPPGGVNSPGVAGRYKVGGSAQRKLRGALLQHGSVLVQQSVMAPELPGLSELGVTDASVDRLAGSLTRQLQEQLGLAGRSSQLTASEQAAIRSLIDSHHTSATWLRKR